MPRTITANPRPDDNDGRDEFVERILALPPLTDEQLDSLADTLAWIELEQS